MSSPIKVSAFRDGAVAVAPPATINCPMTAALDRWMGGPVQQAGRRYFGQPVVGINPDPFSSAYGDGYENLARRTLAGIVSGGGPRP